MLKVALLYTEKTGSERDLGKMITHLTGILTDMSGVSVESVALKVDTPLPNYNSFHHLVFCGYDHITLSHLHFALHVTDPNSVHITLYDEPGASIERELNTLLFRGVDVNARIPSASVTRLTHSWSHNDIVAVCKQDVLKYTHEGPERPTGDATSPKPTKPVSRPRSGGSRTRQVEVKGAAQAREGDAGVEGGGGDGVGDVGG